MLCYVFFQIYKSVTKVQENKTKKTPSIDMPGSDIPSTRLSSQIADTNKSTEFKPSTFDNLVHLN